MAESTDDAVRKLRSDVARQISTGQVVVSLMGACRELIDNALDAGASTVEVRLKEHGADALEVSDNGHGISSENFSALGKPHATSKLTDLNDFNSLLTFGFRGEALNALCALSNVTITTRHKLAKLGTKLTFSPTGEILSQTVATRPIGTTVCVEKLFYALPVRRKEFVKNAKREMHRLLGAVQAFALSRTDVRFTVSNGTGVKSIQILNSPGNNAPVMQVMTALFGASVSKKSLIPIKSAEPDGKCLEIYELPNDEEVKKECEQINLNGYVSNCEAGNGRHVSDRQFVFINKRPVDHAKLCKIANELYNVFNKNSYCILVLFIEVDPSQLDVNVTPDKRIVYLRNEKELFAKFRASLLATFESVAGKNTAARETLPTQSQMFTANDLPANDSRTDDYDLYGSPTSSPRREPVNISGMLRYEKGKRGKEKQRNERSEKGPPPLKRPCTMDSFVNRLSKMEDVVSSPRLTQTVQLQSRLNADDFNTEIDRSFLANSTALDEVINLENDREFNLNRICGEDQREDGGLSEENMSQNSGHDTTIDDISIGNGLKLIPILSMPREENLENFDDFGLDGEDNGDQGDEGESVDLCDEDYVPLWREIEESDIRSEVFSYNFRSQKTQNQVEEEEEKSCVESTSDLDVIANADFDEPPEKAEERLNLLLKAENFAEMAVIGQYNNAFILARHGQEIFLIDQHAADEKFNFEWLQKNAKVKPQGVCDQRQMSLGPVEEAVLISHLDILAASGFEFEVNEEAASGQKVLLSSLPTVCGWHFDASDVEECISALRQFPSTMYRPVKLRKIFASKACRKSVMFGDTLSMEKMVKIVRHMGTMEQPWNCPHGRPTIRHVCTLKDEIELPLSEYDDQEESSQETDITFDLGMDEEGFDKENLNETQYEDEI